MNSIKDYNLDSKLKLKYSFIISTVMFLLGHLITYIGLATGRKMAIFFSRPRGASSWLTSNEMIRAFQIAPSVLGISLIILSIIWLSLILNYWLKE